MYVWQGILICILQGIVLDIMYKYAFKKCLKRGAPKRKCENWKCKMCTECEFSSFYGFDFKKKVHKM